MLSMEDIYEIRRLARHGFSTRQIAAETGFNRETVMKYIKKTDFSVPSPIKKERNKVLDPYRPHIRELIAAEDPEHRLAGRRIHELIASGELTETLPPLEVSVRTVERAVREIRISLAAARFANKGSR